MNAAITPAGFWVRLLAHFIDGIIISLPFWLLYEMLGSALMKNSIAWLGTVVGIAYYAGFLASGWQATPGKRLLNIYVARAGDYGMLSLTHAIGRYMAFYGPYFLLSVYAMTMLQGITDLSAAEQEKVNVIANKKHRHEQLTQHEKDFYQYVALVPMADALPESDKQQLADIHEKLMQEQELTPEENRFLEDALAQQVFSPQMKSMLVIQAVGFLYMLVLVGMVAFTRQKTGLHDVICKTRALRGRPESPRFMAA